MSNPPPTPLEEDSNSSWESDVFGSIATILTHLTSWDQAVKEIVQNADDAEASEIEFKIDDYGISVKNNKLLTFCSNPKSKKKFCDFKSNTRNKLCDVHAIKTFSSQNKKDNSEATGKFGVGFSSVFLFTDAPEMLSGPIRLRFDIENSEVPTEISTDPFNGTILKLPWASDPNSAIRVGLEKNAIEKSQINGIVDEVSRSVSQSMLFVKHLNSAKVIHNGKDKLQLKRHKNGNEIEILSLPGNQIDKWILLESDEAYENPLNALIPQHKAFAARKTKFEVLIPRDPSTDFQGLVYATLATSQRTFLPFHVNAAFFPDTSRNNIAFHDRSNERDLKVLWNRTIIDQCAKFIGAKLPELQNEISNEAIWEIIRNAFSIHKKRTGELVPECFSRFWTEIKQTAQNLEIIENQHGRYCRSSDLFLLIPQNKKHSSALSNLNLSHQIKNDIELLELYKEIGAAEINQKVLFHSISLMFSEKSIFDLLNNLDKIESLYSLIEKILSKDNSIDEDLANLFIWKNTKGKFVKFHDLYLLPNNADLTLAEELYPGVDFPANMLKELAVLNTLLNLLSGDALTNILSIESNLDFFTKSIPFNNNPLETFGLLQKVLTNEPFTKMSVEKLKSIEIWPHSDGRLSHLRNSVLPGSFEDPIGIGNLLAPEKLGPEMSAYLLNSFEIKELNINVYILTLLKVFLMSNVITEANSQRLMQQLISQGSALSDDSIEALKNLEIVFTKSGISVKPSACLFPSEKLIEFCSEDHFNFIGTRFLEDVTVDKSDLELFLRRIGVLFEPDLLLLRESWLQIQADGDNRNREIGRLSKVANALLDLLTAKKKKSQGDNQEVTFASLKWPCTNECTGWHDPTEVIQLRWSKSVCVNENLHPVGILFNKQSPDFIFEAFGVKKYPPIEMAVRHLQHRVLEQVHPGHDFYKLMNWISKNGSDEEKSAIGILRDQAFIYNSGLFLKPRDIYTEIAENLKFLIPYLHLVEKAPEGFESLWQVLGIGKLNESETPFYLKLIKSEILETGFLPDSIDRYKRAISIIGDAFIRDELWAITFIIEFSNSELLLTISNEWISPDLAIIGDHIEWTQTLIQCFGNNLVMLEPIAFEFVQQAGARKLSEELTVHEDSLEVSGPYEEALTIDFQARFEAFYAFLANAMIDFEDGGLSKFEASSYSLSLLSDLRIYAVPQIDVEVSLQIDSSKVSKFVENAPSLYLKGKNVVAFVRGEKEDFNSVFSALIFSFIPTMTPVNVRNLSSTCLVLLSKPANEAIDWLKRNDFLAHDVRPPEISEIVYEEIDLKSGAANGDNDFVDTDFEDQNLGEMDESPLDTEDNSAEELDEVDDRVDISLDSESEKRKSFSGTDSRRSEKSEGDESFRRKRGTTSSQFDRNSQNQHSDAGDEGRSENANYSQKDFKQGIKNPKSNSKPSKRRRSGFAHAEAENGDGLGNVHNTKVEELGVKWIIDKEWEIGRVVRNLNEDVKNNKGFDLISVSNSNPQDVRLIEVKSCAGYWPELGVGLSRAQFEFAMREGFQSWLYVVENALGEDQDKRLHRIQDPWDKIKSVYFDPGWRDIAEVSIQQNPIQIVKGMRIKHDIYELGWISSEPTRQGHAIFIDVDFDNLEGLKKIRWDENVISVIDGDDDLS